MFQKKITDSYIVRLDKSVLQEKYALYSQIFLDKSKQENIRKSKEEQYQEGFLRDLFVSVLGYTIKPENNFNLFTEAKNDVKNKSNSKKADGAICEENNENNVKAVIELKGTSTKDLDLVAFQAFSYKNFHNDCKYIIVSNFERLRFYVEVQSDFEEFDLFRLSFERFCVLYALLEVNQIKNDIALKIKNESLSEEKQITNEFYRVYSAFKRELFKDICENNSNFDKLTLFKKTQKLLDRILFIRFCSDRGLLPANSVLNIIKRWQSAKENFLEVSLYSLFKQFFNWIDTGFDNPKDKSGSIFAYNGGLFKSDEILDNIKIGDDVLYIHCNKLGQYNFESQISVDILGRIFENSLTEIEEVESEISNEQLAIRNEEGEVSPSLQPPTAFSATPSAGTPRNTPSNIGKRKKDGVFYTPEYITRYIVENTIGKLCAAKKEELKINDEEFSPDRHSEGAVATEESPSPKRKKDVSLSLNMTKELDSRLEAYRAWLLQLKILDPACGSGAFLNAALQALRKEHILIDSLWSKIHKGELNFSQIDNSILENNLYGVDINEDSIEITKLSLWLNTAKKNRKLTTLNGKIKCGNSLISDKAVAGEKAFVWEEEFPEVFKLGSRSEEVGSSNSGQDSRHSEHNEESHGGFDVIIGNPPYVQLQSMGAMSDAYAKCGFESYNKSADLYCLFYERGCQLLKDGGMLGFIASNKWLKANYGENLRRFFVERTNPLMLVDFPGVKIFPDATVDPQILILKKEPYQKKTFACLYDSDSTDVSGFVEQNKTETAFSAEPWRVIPSGKAKIIAKMNAFEPLKNLPFEIYRGVLTGLDEAFYIDEETKNQLIAQDPKSAELIKPVLFGHSITAWTVQPQEYLINPHNGIKEKNIPPVNIEEYPAIKTHLDQFYQKLAKRTDKGDTPYNLRNCAYLESFSKPKIIYPEVTKYRPFMYDESGIMVNKTCFILVQSGIAREKSVSLKALAAILNSKLADFWIWFNCPEVGDDRRHMGKAYFENFPIPKLLTPNSSLLTPNCSPLTANLSSLADQMLSLTADLQKQTSRFLGRIKETYGITKITQNLESFYNLSFADFARELAKQKVKLTLKQKDELEDYFGDYVKEISALNKQISATDAQINSLVYALYGLSAEEIAIVEKS